VLVSTEPGGGPQHVLDVATGLRARGWRPIVAGPPGGAMVARFRQAGLETIAARTDRLGSLAAMELVRLIRRRDVRLVHSHGKGAGLHARLAARITGVPAVHTLHGIHFERYGRIRRGAYLALERRLSRATSVVVNVSHAQEAEGLALGLFTRAQSRVVLNGVDVARLASTALDRQDARAAVFADDARLIGLNAARFDAVKRLDMLLRAVAAVPDPTLRVVLIGRGEEEAALKALATSLDLTSRTVFAGEIPDAAQLFRAFDLYVAPSAKEGLPLALLEAMAAGLPVVASDIPGHREVLGAASPGLVAGTPEAFASALRTLLADPEARRALGAEQRTRARSEFDARQMLIDIEAIYGRLLSLV